MPGTSDGFTMVGRFFGSSFRAFRASVALGLAALFLGPGCSGKHGRSDGGVAPDLAPRPMQGNASLLSAGSYLTLALTPDNVALVTDAQATLFAVPLAGGAATPLEARVAAAVRIGDAVFVWHDVDAQFSAHLAVFVRGQLRELATGSPAAVAFPTSAASDGTHIAFVANHSGGFADLFAQRSDGGGQVALATSIDVKAACAPAMTFVAQKLIVSGCNGGVFSIVSYDPDSGAATTLLAPASPGFVPVPARVAVVALNPMNGSSLYPVDGTPATPLAAGVKRSLAFADGSAAVQLTLGGGIVRARLSDGGLTSLVAAGGDELAALSSDGAWVLYTGPPDATSGNAELFLASARVPGMTSGSSINAGKTSPPVNSGRFTDDASWVVYTTDADAFGHGPLRARPLAGTIGASRTLSLASAGFVTAGGARLVYTDRYIRPDAGLPRVNLALVDLASSAAPTLLAAGASLAWHISDDMHRVAFLVSDGSNAGLYVAPLP
jgi:hypothetical protein